MRFHLDGWQQAAVFPASPRHRKRVPRLFRSATLGRLGEDRCWPPSTRRKKHKQRMGPSLATSLPPPAPPASGIRITPRCLHRRQATTQNNPPPQGRSDHLDCYHSGPTATRPPKRTHGTTDKNQRHTRLPRWGNYAAPLRPPPKNPKPLRTAISNIMIRHMTVRYRWRPVPHGMHSGVLRGPRTDQAHPLRAPIRRVATGRRHERFSGLHTPQNTQDRVPDPLTPPRPDEAPDSTRTPLTKEPFLPVCPSDGPPPSVARVLPPL